MSRIRVAMMLAAIASLLIAANAFAAKVSGGTTTITPSTAAVTVLSNNHIAVTAIAPATAANTGALTFPIVRGRVNAKTLHGRLAHSGGVKLSNGTDNVVIRHLQIISTKRGAYIWALVRSRAKPSCGRLHHHRLRGACFFVTGFHFARIAKITTGSVSGTTFTGNLTITQVTANVINRLAGSKVVAAGAPLGTISIAPTLS